jgi:glucans biosynthesis protein C
VRMAFVDNIRWTVIAMVVLVHAAVTYSGIGSWYYKAPVNPDAVSMLVFYLYETFSQAFFMGILFFVAAVFTPGAYDRKGFGRFLQDRFLRLGVPTLVFMFVVHPATLLVRDGGKALGASLAEVARWYGRFVVSGRFVGESGPLWFAFALLGFSLVYALGRLIADKVRRERAAVTVNVSPAGVHRGALLLIGAMAVGTFLVRLVQPIGTSFYNMQLCFFTQYILLFSIGLWAGRIGLLRALPAEAGKAWMRLAFAVGVPVWLLLMGLGGVLNGNQAAYVGGWHWQSAALAAWESFFCVAFSIGLITWYRERFNVRNRVTGLLANTSFGIYVFHAPLLVGAAMLMRPVSVGPLTKWLVIAAAAWTASLAVAWLVRRIPAVGRLFS